MKRQYIAAVACLMAGAIGFVGVYSTERAQERKHRQELVQSQQEEQEKQISAVSSVIEPKTKVTQTQEKKVEGEETEKSETKESTTESKEEVTVEPKLHFTGKKNCLWPVKGEILLPYSMNATIYFSTLDQYRYNPAMVIKGNINDKVIFITKGKITDITTNEETGCTVTQDLGDGYTAIYGQLKELTFNKGDSVEGGQVVGYIAEPTKYYSVEGSNVYFAMQKDGNPIDPMEYLSDTEMGKK